VLDGRSFIAFTVFLGLIFTNAALAAPVPLSHLSEGRPGCYSLFHNGALTSKQIAELPVECQEFRDDYFSSIDLGEKNPKAYEQKLVQALTKAHEARAPYEAIFFATLIHSKALKHALQKRAAVEKKLKVPFQYANVALYRLDGKECFKDKTYSNDSYRELCNSEDTILPTLFDLAEQKRLAKKKGSR
jgi:hypothetical protein